MGDKALNKVIDYVPHGMNSKFYYPIESGSPESEEMEKIKQQLFPNGESKFTLFFNSRNIRRKSIPDTMLAWKYFIDGLPENEANECYFILHTDLVSDAGTDLLAVRDYIFGSDYKNIIFSTNKLPANNLNILYNIADAQILLTSNEGWGLTLTEAMLAGTPIIANVTGGMQDQMRFEDEDGNWFTPSADVPSNHTGKYKKHGKWAFPVYPNNRSLVGSPQTPYIWDDRCRPEDATERIMELYNMTREERKALGLAGHEWATGDEAKFTSKKMGETVIKNIEQLFATWKPRKHYELMLIQSKKINYHINCYINEVYICYKLPI